MEQKFKHGKALHDIYGITRPILADALDGACHRAYGGNPNMTWIFNSTGTILYKSDWTDCDSVISMIEYLLDMRERRKNRERLGPFRVERIEYREVDRDKFYEGLRRNGPQAVEDFARTFPDTVPNKIKNQTT